MQVALVDPPGSGLYNKVLRGVMYTREEAEGHRLRHPCDTITEGVGINRITANFARVLTLNLSASTRCASLDPCVIAGNNPACADACSHTLLQGRSCAKGFFCCVMNTYNPSLTEAVHMPGSCKTQSWLACLTLKAGQVKTQNMKWPAPDAGDQPCVMGFCLQNGSIPGMQACAQLAPAA